MEIRGEVYGTFPVHGVPARRVRRAKKLGFQTQAHRGFFDGSPYDARRGLPGGTAGGSAKDRSLQDFSVGDFHDKFRRSETLSIKSQADLPGKCASGEWRNGAFDVILLSRGDHRNTFVPAQHGEVLRKIGMPQEIQHQVRLNIGGQILTCVVE